MEPVSEIYCERAQLEVAKTYCGDTQETEESDPICAECKYKGQFLDGSPEIPEEELAKGLLSFNTKTCSVAGCNKEASIKGMCRNCYANKRYHDKKKEAREGGVTKKHPVIAAPKIEVNKEGQPVWPEEGGACAIEKKVCPKCNYVLEITVIENRPMYVLKSGKPEMTSEEIAERYDELLAGKNGQVFNVEKREWVDKK